MGEGIRTREGGPDPVDAHVGARIRARRRVLGFSVHWLGQAVGVTHQQMVKYEQGSNRVSASRLYALARALAVDVGWFFEGLGQPRNAVEAAPEHPPCDDDAALEAEALVKYFRSIDVPGVRDRVLRLVRDLALETQAPAAAPEVSIDAAPD